MSRQRIQVKPSAFSFNSTLFINVDGVGTAGANTFIGGLNSANIEVDFGVAVRFQHGLASTNIMETIDTGIWLPAGSLFITEKAAQETPIATRGELWVRTDTFSNTLIYTNDNGSDFEIGGLPYQGDVLDGSLLLTGTTFGGAANLGPKQNSFYTIIARGQFTTPDAADDGKVQLTVDTLSVFQGLYTDSKGQVVSMQSALGEVVTNTVVVDTDGSGVDDGTYFQIIGTLKTGANAQTFSLRVAKNADAGGDGLCSFPSLSVVPLTD